MRLAILVTFVALLCVPYTARADASARLVYMRGPGAEQCPGESAFRAAVALRLGYDPFFAVAHDVLFFEIARRKGVFAAHIRLVDDENLQRGARDIEIEGNDCAPIIDSLALTISLVIDPSSLLQVAISPVPPATIERPDPSARLPEPDAVALRPRSSTGERTALPGSRPTDGDTVRLQVGAGVLGSIGAEPTATVGALLFGELTWRAVSLGVEGRADLPASGASDQPPARVRTSLVAVSLVPCLNYGAFYGCGIVSAGSLAATSVDVREPHESRAAWWATGARAGLEVRLTRLLALRGWGESLATLSRYWLSIDGVAVYKLPAISGGLGVSLAATFP